MLFHTQADGARGGKARHASVPITAPGRERPKRLALPRSVSGGKSSSTDRTGEFEIPIHTGMTRSLQKAELRGPLLTAFDSLNGLM